MAEVQVNANEPHEVTLEYAAQLLKDFHDPNKPTPDPKELVRDPSKYDAQITDIDALNKHFSKSVGKNGRGHVLLNLSEDERAKVRKETAATLARVASQLGLPADADTLRKFFNGNWTQQDAPFYESLKGSDEEE